MQYKYQKYQKVLEAPEALEALEALQCMIPTLESILHYSEVFTIVDPFCELQKAFGHLRINDEKREEEEEEEAQEQEEEQKMEEEEESEIGPDYMPGKLHLFTWLSLLLIMLYR